jgi:hypothetical protein
MPGPTDSGSDDEVFYGQTNEDVVEQLVGVDNCVCGFVGGDDLSLSLARGRLSLWVHAITCQWQPQIVV